MIARRARSILLAVAAVATMSAIALGAGTPGEWLSLGSKHWAPTVTSSSGIGTAKASAEARVTRQEIEGWCANWSPGDKGCVARELASPEAKQNYRASADCTQGRITAIDGKTYKLAGTWDSSDIGGGRTRWRDSSGKVVGRDNASGGLAISQQWEVLCPGPVKTPQARNVDNGTQKRVPSVPATQFAVGQVIEARYGTEWVRGRINAIRQVSGAGGTEVAYDVRLDNGKRGVLPARMVRRAAGT